MESKCPAHKVQQYYAGGGCKNLKSKEWKRCFETVSSGNDKTPAPMSSQQVWLPSQNLHKIKPVNIPT